MNEKYLAVPAALVQKVCDYLKSKPFDEVANLINSLVQCPIVTLAPPAPPPEEKKGD